MKTYEVVLKVDNIQHNMSLVERVQADLCDVTVSGTLQFHNDEAAGGYSLVTAYAQGVWVRCLLIDGDEVGARDEGVR